MLKGFSNNKNYNSILNFCDYSYFRARAIFENASLFEKCFEFAKFCVFNLKNTNQMASIEVFKNKEEILLVLEILQSFYLDLSKQELGCKCKYLELEQFYERERNLLNLRAITIIVGKLNEANKKIFSNVSPQMVLETLLVEILEVKFLCK